MGDNIPELPKDQLRLKDRPSRARYDKVYLTLERKWRRRELKPERMMREIVDVLWDAFSGSPYSWCGFYILAADGQNLILGPHRDAPACSPLPMHGVCGRAARSGQAMIVPDVKALGEAHIECDPRNLSEIALPVFDKNGRVWAVFDVDSAQPAAFNDMDQRWLEKLLKNFQDISTPESAR
ncbi:MAG: GAF domain-containing protein [Elusimicrobiota bacterium]|jgi:putative methionine-R-sulfoxide reductase with GAF domain